MGSLGNDSISVQNLHFDPANPRIPPHVDGRDDQAVLDWMLTDAGLVELMGSIAVNGFFPAEPLLVMAIPGSQVDFYVLEGNRRLAAVRLLLEPERAPRRKVAVAAVAAELEDAQSLRSLPCALFEYREDVLDYLGYRHITGIKEWEPAAKARYLRELYDEHLTSSGSEVYRKIARIIGSRSDYVMRLLGSLRLYDEMHESAEDQLSGDIDLASISFSLLTLALNYSNIVAYLGLRSLTQEGFDDLDREHLRELSSWMFLEDPERGRTQLGESRNMKLLAAAISKEPGLAALKNGASVEEAAVASLDVSDVILRSVRQANSNLLNAQRYLHRADVNDAFRSAQTVLTDILDLVDSMLSASRRRERREAENV